MEFRILGPVEALADGRPVPLPRRRQRALVAVLVLNVGEAVSTDRLLDAFWGERPPRTAKEAVQNAVHQLRRLLGPETIVRRPPGYALAVESAQTDLGLFEQLTAQARATTDPGERAAKLREALALWRGPPLADLEFEPFAQLELPRLNELHLGAREDLVDAELELGHLPDLAALESLAATHPYDERLRCQLALALYRAGRQADALEACRNAMRALRDELGLEPGPELRAREQAILRQDPALDAPRTAGLDGPPARKTVTVLFVDLVDPDGLAGERDPEALRALVDRSLAETRARVEKHGGTIHELLDEAASAMFGLPTAHEDDALRAVRAAVEIRQALATPDGDLRPRIGITTGEVYVADSPAGRVTVTGTPVHVARRLERAARPDEILLGATTLRLVRGAVETAPTEPLPLGGGRQLPVFRLLSVRAGAPAFDRHLEAPLVDRVAELAELQAAYESTYADRRCRVVTVLGDAGIGKTRLVAELAGLLRGDAAVLAGSCVSYGEGATYLPLREAVAHAGGELDTVLAGAASTGEEFLAVRRYLEGLARSRPLLIVFEDVHWAEPTFLDLVEYLGQQVSGARMLVVCLARGELLEARPDWPALLRLAPLREDETQTLLERLAGELDPAVRMRIVQTAEGNPLYAEQLLAYADEGGSFESLPPTLEALLGSRLDRLPAAERAVLQCAAVVGREFGRATVAELSPPEAAGALDAQLAELAGKGLVVPSAGDELRFQHALIRDVAYAGLPKARRAELHERLAGLLAGEPDASDELTGYHLEQAHGYLAELGPVEEHAERLAHDAGARLGSAGMRAWKRGDAPAAVNLLGRAAALLPARDAFRLELLCELGVALRGTGEVARAEATLAEAADAGAASGDRRGELRARLELANVRLFAGTDGRAGDLLDAAAAAIPVFEAAGDDHSIARAWRLIGAVEGSLRCRYAAAAEAAERALQHERDSGWSTAACLGDLAAALYYGPTPAPEAIRRCRALLEDADPGGEAHVLVELGALEAMEGRFDDARELVARSQALYEDLGQVALAHVNCGTLGGQIELLAGDHREAERILLESFAGLEAIGERAHLATRAAELAEAVYRDGRHDEADRWARLAEEVGGADDIPTQFQWRAVRAKLLASAGDAAQALAVGREAARLAGETDSIGQHATVLLDLAEVLRLCGEDAAPAAAQALALFEQKGNTAGAERARAFLAAL